jgi:hypothetical protein
MESEHPTAFEAVQISAMLTVTMAASNTDLQEQAINFLRLQRIPHTTSHQLYNYRT